jgi:hypothetical protein
MMKLLGENSITMSIDEIDRVGDRRARSISWSTALMKKG